MPIINPLNADGVNPGNVIQVATDPLNTGNTKSQSGNVNSFTRERYAHSIALVIVWTFAAAVVLLIGLVYWVVLKYPWIDGSGNIKDGKISYRAVALLTEAAAPALKEFGSFISTVFGSLLAFVLGYYFGEQKHSSRD